MVGGLIPLTSNTQDLQYTLTANFDHEKVRLKLRIKGARKGFYETLKTVLEEQKSDFGGIERVQVYTHKKGKGFVLVIHTKTNSKNSENMKRGLPDCRRIVDLFRNKLNPAVLHAHCLHKQAPDKKVQRHQIMVRSVPLGKRKTRYTSRRTRRGNILPSPA